MDNVLEEAIRLRSDGLAVHWLRPKSKAPFEEDWATRPVKSASELRRTFRPGYNVGFRPGKHSPMRGGNVVVLDIDVRGGERYVEEAYAAARSLTGSDDYSVKSGSGYGRHVYYICPRKLLPQKAATTLRESDVVIDGKPAWKVELLATGKNVVLPPSEHPDTGQRYEWLNKNPPQRIPKEILDRLAEVTGQGAWPEPEEIRTTLLPVPKLHPSLLPAPLAPWIQDVAFRMQCPVDYVAGPALIVAAALIGTRCGVRPKRKDDWTVIPNLWGGIVGSPSTLKSPAMKEAMKPIEELERRAKAAFEEEQSHHLMDQLSKEIERKDITKRMEAHLKARKPGPNGLLAGSDPQLDKLRERLSALADRPEPTWRRYKTNDSTVEKVVELEAENPRGLLVYRDELAGLLAAIDREDRPGDRAFYLEGWAGDQGYTSDRIGRGHIHAPRHCLSVLGGIQPSKLAGYLHDALANYANDGLMQRFQVTVYPDEPKNWKLVDRKPDEHAARRALDLLVKVADVDFDLLGAQVSSFELGRGTDKPKSKAPRLEQRYLHFADDAQDFFNAWLTTLQTEKLRGSDSDLMVQHLSKYRSLMPSLALIIHAIDLVDSGGKGPISLAAAKQAAGWCDYLEQHARRIYGLAAGHAQEAAKALAARLRKGELTERFTERDVYRKCWASLSDPEQVARACRELEACGWIRRVQQPRSATGGRPASPTYEVNPKVMKPNGRRGH